MWCQVFVRTVSSLTAGKDDQIGNHLRPSCLDQGSRGRSWGGRWRRDPKEKDVGGPLSRDEGTRSKGDVPLRVVRGRLHKGGGPSGLEKGSSWYVVMVTSHGDVVLEDDRYRHPQGGWGDLRGPRP